MEKRKYSDRAEYLKKAVTERHQKIKRLALEYMGNKCKICEYDRCIRALGFHHLDPKQKDFAIGARGHSRAWNKVKEELSKCVLLCSNCHQEIHDGFTKL